MLTEVCVDSLHAAIEARDAFVRALHHTCSSHQHTPSSQSTVLRLELCSALHQGGLTPSMGFVRSVYEEMCCSPLSQQRQRRQQSPKRNQSNDADNGYSRSEESSSSSSSSQQSDEKLVVAPTATNQSPEAINNDDATSTSTRRHKYDDPKSEKEQNEPEKTKMNKRRNHHRHHRDDETQQDHEQEEVQQQIKVELFLMIRCRAGLDFEYTDAEIKTMIADVHAFGAFKKALDLAGGSSVCRIPGIVFGALRRPRNKRAVDDDVMVCDEHLSFHHHQELAPAAGIDERSTFEVCQAAASHNFIVTFHRALDYMGANATPGTAAQFVNALGEILRINKSCSAVFERRHIIMFVLSSGGVFQSAAKEGAVEFLDDASSRISASNFLEHQRQQSAGNSNREASSTSPPSTVRIIVGGGVDHAVVDRVRRAITARDIMTAKLISLERQQQQRGGGGGGGDGDATFSTTLNSQLVNSIAIGGVHFSAKIVVKPKGVPDSEAFWKFDAHLAEELFLGAMRKGGASGVGWSSL